VKMRKIMICIVLVLVMMVSFISPSVTANAETSYYAEILKSIGLFQSANESEYISYYDCALMLLATLNLQKSVLSTSGDAIITDSNKLTEAQMKAIKNYFNQHTEYSLNLYFGGSVIAVPPVSKADAGSNNSRVPSYIIYKCTLIALGYMPDSDFADTKSSIMDYAVKVGFNKSYLINNEASTFGDLANIFYDSLFLLRIDGKTIITFMSSANAALKKSAENCGMFQTFQSSLPDFTYGSVMLGSYKETVGKYTECEIKYTKTTLTEFTEYISCLKNFGWLNKVSYTKNTTSGSSSVKEYFYTYSKMINSKEYFAVIMFNNNTKITTIWYAY